jgi:hypothetical protein
MQNHNEDSFESEQEEEGQKKSRLRKIIFKHREVFKLQAVKTLLK